MRRSSLGCILCAVWALSGCGSGWSSAGPQPVPLTYQVGRYKEYATLAMPPRGKRSPAVVVLHGGFWGDDKGTDSLAQELARRGVVAAVPAYRGEKRALDGRQSDGTVEFCAGEVEDALAMVRELRQRPDVDPDRIALLGFSHGGCIALRTAERDQRLAAVVTFSAPTEAAFTYTNLKRHPLTGLGFGGWLGGKLHGYVGAEPQHAPQSWAERSPLYQTASLTQPLLLVQGTGDHLVPVQEVCMLRDALHKDGRQVVERFFDKNGLPEQPQKQPCAAAPPVASATGPRLPVELWYFAEQGHTFGKRAREAAQHGALDFLVKTLHAPGAAPDGRASAADLAHAGP